MSNKVMTPAAIILAAGLSRRMGTQDKLAMDLGGKPLVRHAIDAALNSNASSVMIVTNDAAMAQQYPGAVGIPAPDAPLGQGHSLKAGFKALCAQPNLPGALVLLGDMPFIRAGHINALITQARETPQDICRFVHNGTPGHPVYWPARFFKQIAALSGDEGAPAIMKANRAQVRTLPSSDDAVIFDVDTPERLDAARVRLEEAL